MPSSFPYCNSHTHFDSQSSNLIISAEPSVISVCAEDVAEVVSMMPSAMVLTSDEEGGAPGSIKPYVSVGVHPWTVATLSKTELPAHLSLVEQALEQSRQGSLPFNLVAAGECGFDLLGEDRRATYELQHEALHAHMELALQYEKPLVLHCVKGIEPLLKHHHDLKKLPAVIFHGYAGSVNEAETFLRRGINAYFSFGAAILSGKGWPPRALAAVPSDRLLLETDGKPLPLQDIYQCAAGILSAVSDEKKASAEDLQKLVYRTFCAAYGLS